VSVPIALASPPPTAPRAPIRQLSSVWIQVTGTWCNLTCIHCFNASGPKDPWVRRMAPAQVRAAIDEAASLGVKEIYYTGGEPFLHPDILDLTQYALRHAPTTVLTNGTLITGAVAERLGLMAAASRYSLEIRLSLDAADREANDAIRGKGVFDRVLRAALLLEAQGLLPIMTVSEMALEDGSGGGAPAGPAAADAPAAGPYAGLREMLLAAGIRRPRIKIIPVFHMGRLAQKPRALTPAHLEGFDFSLLQCTESRAVTADGVYSCPILAGLPGARLSAGSLADSLAPCALYHSACVTCYETGMTCRNF
jgi:hypothetical protein